MAYLLVAVLLLNACGEQQVKPETQNPTDIRIDQLGYEPGTAKKALVRTDAGAFQVISSEGEVVFEGPTGPAMPWELSGDTVRLVDFSPLTFQAPTG